MKFYIEKDSSKFPYFRLDYNRWDDYSRKTSFYLTYRDLKGEYHSIGKIKIMHKDELVVINIIDKEFEELGDDFCSLGQSIGFYEELKFHLKDNIDDFYEVINALNDIAFLPTVKERFEKNRNFRVSLLRYSEAEKAYYEAKRVIENLPIEDNFIFNYSCQLPNAEGLHKVKFNFGDNDNLPNRTIGLIGKNGTGKTQFLAQLALDLSGQSKKLITSETFNPARPLFSKVITVSYSAFDKFSRPKKDKSFSYKYCGLKDENGALLSNKKIIENYENSVKIILEENRHKKWYTIMSAILGDHLADLFYDEIFEKENFEIVDNKNSKILSSGQSFLMYVITEILGSIRNNSLLLFDEPEMHLHPNAIANFIRMLDLLLNQFKSYAIIATHSPIILQEIPSRYVRVFDREKNIPIVRSLNLESFGENLEELTEEVFQTKDVIGTYKEILEKLSQKMSYDEVLLLFEKDLSLNSKTYLYNLYKND